MHALDKPPAVAGRDPHTGVGTIRNPCRYDGRYTDPESGLQYLRNRYYDSATTQFLTVDPLSSITMQPYSYAGDDPLNGGDPTGLSCQAGPIALPIGGSGDCSTDLPHQRLPDYRTVQFQFPVGEVVGAPFLGIQFGFTYDRNGNSYFGAGGALSLPSAAGWNVNAGHVNSPCVAQSQLEQYVSGWTLSAGGYGSFGSQVVNGNVGQFGPSAFGPEFGVGIPEVGASATYAWKLPIRWPVHW